MVDSLSIMCGRARLCKSESALALKRAIPASHRVGNARHPFELSVLPSYADPSSSGGAALELEGVPDVVCFLLVGVGRVEKTGGVRGQMPTAGSE